MGVLETARARPLTMLAIVAAVIVFLMLLNDNAGFAILVALLVVPVAILAYLTRIDLYEREPWALLTSVVGAGALVGLLGGLLSAFFFERFWFSDSRLNLGAIGFPGVVANGEGSVPYSVVLLGGILIPVLTGAAILGGPFALRRWPIFRNEITDGMTLGGLAAAGFATVSSFVYFWPSAFGSLPDRPVSQWTALLAGIAVVRPVVLIIAGSLLGIAAWKYLATKNIRAVLVPGVAGVFGWLALPLGSLFLAASGAVAEFVWYALVLIVVGIVFRHVLGRSLSNDGQVLAPSDGEQRVVCSNCHRVTPDGSFCSFCRAPLHPEAPVALGTIRPQDPIQGEQGERPTLEPPTAHSDSAPEPTSVPSPIMAPAASETRDRYPEDQQDHSSEFPLHVERDLIVEVAAEPEADALDYLDPAPTVSEATARSDSSSTPEPPAYQGLIPDSDPATSRFRSPEVHDLETANRAGTSGSTGERSTDLNFDLDPVDAGEGEEQNSPISLHDWSRQPQALTEAPRDDDSRDADASPPPARPVTSPWRRPAEATSEPATGLKWPTSAASSMDRSVASARFPVTSETDSDDDHPPEAVPDGPGSADESEQRPVESSSGRWFDASSSLAGPTPSVSVPGPGENRPDGFADESLADLDRATSNEGPVPEQESEPVGPSDEATSLEEPSPPPGLRWYRPDDEIDQSAVDDVSSSEPGQRDWEAEPLASSPTPVPDITASDQPFASETGPQNSSGSEGRTGIWRSITRQGRGGTPRAPHRDQGRTDETP